MLSGCSSVPFVQHLSPDAHQMKLGEKAFSERNYEEADKIFSEIYSGSSTKEAKNSSLFYLACTRIITAKDTSEFISAVKLLEEWKASYPKLMYSEDPDILKKALGIGSQNMADEQQALRQAVTTQKKQIEELKTHVKTLRHQIAELEAIDQQLQEKRNPL